MTALQHLAALAADPTARPSPAAQRLIAAALAPQRVDPAPATLQDATAWAVLTPDEAAALVRQGVEMVAMGVQVWAALVFGEGWL